MNWLDAMQTALKENRGFYAGWPHTSSLDITETSKNCLEVRQQVVTTPPKPSIEPHAQGVSQPPPVAFQLWPTPNLVNILRMLPLSGPIGHLQTLRYKGILWERSQRRMLPRKRRSVKSSSLYYSDGF